MPAEIWRIPAPKVHAAGGMTFIQDNGVMHAARPTSSGWYVFSEVGAGVEPLCIVGKKGGILRWLSTSETGVVNQIEELPEIYVKVVSRTIQERYKVVNPRGDAAVAIVKSVASMTPGSMLTDLAGTMEPLRDLLKGSKTQERPKATGEYAVIVHYLQGNGFVQLGSGTLRWSELYERLNRSWWLR